MTDLPARLPRHVAIIMDGNGRWAERRGLPRNEGHLAGAESARAVARCCVDLKIPVLTLYAFSTENWNRPRPEVRFLMAHLRRFLKKHRQEFVEHDIRVRPIGAVEELPAAVLEELRATEEATENCRALTLVVALNYGSHREITDAARSIARRVQRGEMQPEAIDEQVLEEHLYTAGLPAPDLLIRTGGEMRLSNFLLWQLSYAELYVTETLWPAFRRREFLRALHEFARRERRFGALRRAEGTSAGQTNITRSEARSRR
jgi:undecaprenyl diphosphate synthase